MDIIKKLMGAVAALAVPAMLVVSAPASASVVNLLTNGDFQTGDLTGWSVADPSNNSSVTNSSGTSVAWLGVSGTTGYLSQQVATTIGQTYTLSFDLSVDYRNSESFESFTAGLNLQGPHGDPLLTLTSGSVSLRGAEDYNFTNYVLAFTATDATTDITFASRFDDEYWLLDNVTLTANDIAATPLPGSVYLFMSGLGLIGFIAWRNKRGGFARSMAA
jgi:hypothetical protein